MSTYQVGIEVFAQAPALKALEPVLTMIKQIKHQVEIARNSMGQFNSTLEQLANLGKRMKVTGEQWMVTAGLINSAANDMTRKFWDTINTYGVVEEKTRELITLWQGQGIETARKWANIAANEAWKFARRYSTSADVIMEATYRIVSAGIQNVNVATKLAQEAVKLARATRDTPEMAALGLANVVNAFYDASKIGERQISHISDVLAYTQQQFQLFDLSQFLEGFKYAAAPARLLKMNLEDVSIALGVLNTTALQGSQAGTALRQLLYKLPKAAKALGIQIYFTKEGTLDFVKTLYALKNRLESIKDPVQKQILLNKIFQDRATAALNPLLKKLPELAENIRKVNQAYGLTEKSFQIMERSLRAQLKVLKNNFMYLAYVIGRTMAPAVLKISNFIRVLTNAIANFSQAHPLIAKLVGSFLALSAVVTALIVPALMLGGTLSWTVGNSLVFISKLGTALNALKIGVALLGGSFSSLIVPILLLIGLGFVLYKAWKSNIGGMKTELLNLSKKIKGIFKSFELFSKILVTIFKEWILPLVIFLAKLLSYIVGSVLAASLKLINGILHIVTRIAKWLWTMGPAAKTFLLVLGPIGWTLMGIISLVKKLKTRWEEIKYSIIAVRMMFEALLNLIKKAWYGLFGSVLELTIKIADSLPEWMKPEWYKKFISGAKEALRGLEMTVGEMELNQEIIQTSHFVKTTQPAAALASSAESAKSPMPQGINPQEVISSSYGMTGGTTVANQYYTTHYEQGAIQINVYNVDSPEELAEKLAAYLKQRLLS